MFSSSIRQSTYLVLFTAYLHPCPKCRDLRTVWNPAEAASHIQGTLRFPAKEKRSQTEVKDKARKMGVKRKKTNVSSRVQDLKRKDWQGTEWFRLWMKRLGKRTEPYN